jgi:hypothetical protein
MKRNRIFSSLTALILMSLLLISCGTSPPTPDKAQVKAVLVDWRSVEGQTRLAESEVKRDFFQLAGNYVSQDNSIICGLATAATVLNSLYIRKRQDLPVDKSSIPSRAKAYLSKSYNPFFPKFTPNNLLSNQTKSIEAIMGKPKNVKGKTVKDFGLQLEQLAQVFRSHGARVDKTVVTDNISFEAVKRAMMTGLKTSETYVVVNYSRKKVQQKGGGHISTVGAYHRESDSFLILDTNANKAPWMWVDAKALYRSMQTFDTVENRGFLIISDQL